MKLIIDIDEKDYKLFVNENYFSPNIERIKTGLLKGIPLPKDHGRLIDARKFGADEYLEHRYGSDFYWEFRRRLDKQPTIIEADMERSDSVEANH